jgi:hypothetical protein
MLWSWSFWGWPENHIPLFFKILDDARHHFDGETVAKVAEDQANQIGRIGAGGSGDVYEQPSSQ